MRVSGIDNETVCRVTDERRGDRWDFSCVLFQAGGLGQRDARAAITADTQGAGPLRSGTFHDYNNGQNRVLVVTALSANPDLTVSMTIDGIAHTFTGQRVNNAALMTGSFRGVYTSAYMRGAISFDVQQDGTVFGQGAGCIVNGAINDLGQYGYFLEFDLFHCGTPDGLYEGFGILSSRLLPGQVGTAIFVFALTDVSLGGYAIK